MSGIRLIVNADDFGFTRDVNEGIIEAHRNGILTATTLMANGAAFDHAVALAQDNPSLDIGCHLVIVQGQSVLDPSRALPATLPDLVWSLLLGQLRVYEEFAAQVLKIKAAGIRPTHLDTHKHTHLLPPVLRAVERVAREFSIPWVRRPFDFRTGTGAAARLMRLRKQGMTSALRGLKSTDHFAGFQLTGILNQENLIETLERLPDGLTEFMCHPGKLGAELTAAPTRLKQSRQLELTALTSAAVRQTIARRGIVLTGYPATDSK